MLHWLELRSYLNPPHAIILLSVPEILIQSLSRTRSLSLQAKPEEMGNYLSCTFIPQPSSFGRARSRASRVVLPGGEIRQFRAAVSAAELMLECPGFFLVNAGSLHIGRRFSPLGADEELRLGNVYVMFPMKRASSVVTAADMAAVFMASTSASKRIAAAKVSDVPDSTNSREAETSTSDLGNRTVREEGGAEGVLAVASPEFGYRLASCRSKKPSLETIKEELPARRRRWRWTNLAYYYHHYLALLFFSLSR